MSLLLIFVLTTAFSLSAQEETGGLPFGLDLGIGVENFQEFDADAGEYVAVAYQTINFSPDLALGDFGLGLDVTFHYRFENDDTGQNQFQIRTADWSPAAAEMSFLELYLPKIKYIRYGLKGSPLYAKLGTIEDGTLGNGFIMGNYSNALFLPDQRIFGAGFDLDGKLFNFPYIGFESFIGNLAVFDVIGGRLFGRPLAWMDIPVIKNLEIGTTLVADRDPYLYLDEDPNYDGDNDPDTAENQVSVWGVDFKLPVLSNAVISMAAFGDFVVENDATGGMLGVGGSLFSFMSYGAQLRILGENFIPVYFDATYDIYRAPKSYLLNNENTIPSYAGWFATTGFSFLDGKIAFGANIDGPFTLVVEEADIAINPEKEYLNYPHLRAVLVVQEGLLPGFFFDAFYDKQNIQSFSDLIDANNAVIGANINYKTGPAVITLAYDLKYRPELDDGTNESPWEVTSSLKTSISLF